MSAPQLPMNAFRFACDDGGIALSIDEILSFPDETCYAGGYGAKGTLSIRADEYAVSATYFFSTGELCAFLRELEMCYMRLAGIATLQNSERMLSLECRFDGQGHIDILGEFCARHEKRTALRFDLRTDQTRILPAIRDLRRIHSSFRDAAGIAAR